jgi:hypothetical protein
MGAGSCGSAMVCGAVRQMRAAQVSTEKVGWQAALEQIGCSRGGASPGRSHQDKATTAPRPLNACEPHASRGGASNQSRTIAATDLSASDGNSTSDRVCARAQGTTGASLTCDHSVSVPGEPPLQAQAPMTPASALLRQDSSDLGACQTCFSRAQARECLSSCPESPTALARPPGPSGPAGVCR